LPKLTIPSFVCPLHFGIESKQLSLSLEMFNRMVTPTFCFAHNKSLSRSSDGVRPHLKVQ